MCFCIVGFFYSLFILPELKGLSLEEIDAVVKDQSGQEDQARRERVARQIGLDKLANQVVQKENVGQTAGAPGEKVNPMTGGKRGVNGSEIV